MGWIGYLDLDMFCFVFLHKIPAPRQTLTPRLQPVSERNEFVEMLEEDYKSFEDSLPETFRCKLNILFTE